GEIQTVTLYLFVPLVIWTLMQLFDGRGNAFSVTAGHYAFFVFIITYALLHFFDNGNKAQPDSSWMIFAVASSLVAIAARVAGLSRKSINIVDVLGIAFTCVTAIAYVYLVKDKDDSLDVLYMAFTLIVILWSLQRGVRTEDRFVINLSTVLFGA